MKIKICGIRRIDSAQAAVDAGSDYLGFNFIKSSKRFIKPESAKKIITQIQSKVETVGVFQNAEIDEINDIIYYLKLDYVQLHGVESPDECRKINANIIKAFSLDRDFDFNQTVKLMKNYNVDYYLIDRKVQGQGEIVDLLMTRRLAKIFPVFFAGGLNCDNVADVVKNVNPYGVDIASGIETGGEEDIEKIKEFIKLCHCGL